MLASKAEGGHGGLSTLGVGSRERVVSETAVPGVRSVEVEQVPGQGQP